MRILNIISWKEIIGGKTWSLAFCIIWFPDYPPLVFLSWVPFAQPPPSHLLGCSVTLKLHWARSKYCDSSSRMLGSPSRGSMVKSGIGHSKSCSCGRRELLQKSLNNHVFSLIYSKYLRKEQIKAGEEAANADEAAEGVAGSSGSAFVLIRGKQYCCNYQPKQVY